MSKELLSFEQAETEGGAKREPATKPVLEVIPSLSPELNPYKDTYCPSDIYEYLLPGGERFGMFSDPYATLRYVDANIGSRNGRFWLDEKVADRTFTPREVKLIEFLSEHRVATRSQIHRVVFPDVAPDKYQSVTDYLKKLRQRGAICSFSWVSPLKDEKKKPLVYGLTRSGILAAEILYQRQFPENFWFQPCDYAISSPSMSTMFLDLAANELYSETKRLDRCISWKRRPQVRLGDGSIHYPGATFEVIKEENSIHLFWLEIVRPGKDWQSLVKSRFQKTQDAISKLSPYQRPIRLIVIVDGDSRVPVIGEMAAKYMPEVQCRYTTDERLLQGLNKETFLSYNAENKEMKLSAISFLQENHKGMTASEYLKQQTQNLEEDDYEE